MTEPIPDHDHERPDPLMVAGLVLSAVNFALLLIVCFR